jgi:3-isopropylmalate/(R)-2-methylmalate dehydratase small subunit
VIVDLVNIQIRAGDQIIECELRAGARESLLNGTWDPIDELLEANAGIESIHNSLAYT